MFLFSLVASNWSSLSAEDSSRRIFSKNLRPAAPAFPLEFRDHAPAVVLGRFLHLQNIPPGATLYSIGDPTDEEQLYLEFLNRSRSDPKAEGLRFRDTMDSDVLQDYKNFTVDLNLLVSQFTALTLAPPLSFNPKLTAAARLHSGDMLTNQFQGHPGSDGKLPGERITGQGYIWNAYGENVFSHARSVLHGHAAFDVDWGGDPSTGGVQNPPGHRDTIHDPIYREIGIGVSDGSNGSVGPQLVTQDFGSRQGLTPFITGVAYYDLDQNNFYSIGEGIEGATVTVSGVKYYSVSASSGGYSVPVPANGTYTVTFSLPGLSDSKLNVAVTNSQNIKVDFVPRYEPPTIAGPDQPVIGNNNAYQFSAVGGAQSYQWKRSQRIPATEIEGAENGLAKIIAVVSAGYQVIDSTVKASGNFSFHLAHPQKEDQTLTLQRLYRITGNSELIFASRLGWAGTAEVAKAQISNDSGVTWQDVWSRVGTETSGQTSFATQTMSLAPFAGQEIMVRFRYDFGSGSFLNSTDRGVGFYVDDISVTNAEELTGEVVSDISGGATFQFNPSTAENFSLRVRAKLPNHYLPWGPAKLVTAIVGNASNPILKIASISQIQSDRIQFDFDVIGTSAGTFQVESSESVAGPWGLDANATIQALDAGTRFRASTSTAGNGGRFYRVRTNQ